jgi:hypothetical protein
VNGIGWNAVNGMIVLWLLYRRRSPLAFARGPKPAVHHPK